MTIGVTGHGMRIPGMHLRSLERFDFDSRLLPATIAAASGDLAAPAPAQLRSDRDELGIEPLFDGDALERI